MMTKDIQVQVILLKLLAVLLMVAFDSSNAQEADLSDRAEAGAIVFKKCMACHQVGPTARNGIGPVLNGVVGRPAGQYSGYSYSSANKRSGLVWDEPTLTRYLRGPGDVVPGTKMVFFGLKKDQEVADVIAYLKRFGREGSVANP
jgi:cytochrome c